MGLIHAIHKAVQDLRKADLEEIGPYRHFFAGGTGIPDDMAVDFFKDNPSIIVVTRDGRKWRNGKEEQ